MELVMLSFQLEEDLDIRYKLIEENIVLNPGVVPHIFDYQTDRKRASTVPHRSLLVKRQRKQLVYEAVAESDRKQHNMLLITPIDEPCASTSALPPEIGCHYTTDNSLMPAFVDTSEVPLQTGHVGIQAKPHFHSKHVLCNN
ncbi:hypothetical protein JTB14_018300 [Gonioctena quinquepunctata]|nr:hypothetical protein JTB14_018300 [Gonioctena quinquepunctata]